MEHVGNDVWEKLCSRCNRLYKIEAKTWATAFEAFRTMFSSASEASGTYDGLTSWCIGCKNNKKHRRDNDIHRDDMLIDQDGKCGICCVEISFQNKTANIDHCHVSGRNRKVLCRLCNVWMAAIDNEEWLMKAIAYRDAHRVEHKDSETIGRDK
jgi:hypothetical protein